MSAANEHDSRLRDTAFRNTVVAARDRAEEELVLAKEALRESNERLQAALSAADTGTFRWDLRSGVLDLDESAAHLFGFASASDVSTLDDLSRAVHVDDRATLLEACELASKARSDLHTELRVPRPNDGTSWIAATGRLFTSPDGAPLYVTGAFTDVTRRHAAEDALREGADRLLLAFAAGRLGDWSWDAATDEVKLGPRAAAIVGIAPGSEVTRATLRERFHPDDRDAARSAFEEALAKRVDFESELRIVRPSGDDGWISMRGRATYARSGAVTGMIGIIQDVTERRQAEDALRAGAERLRAVTDAAPALIAYVDADHRYRFINKQYELWFGRPSSEIVGKPMREVLGDDVYERVRPHLARALAGEPVQFETPMPDRSGAVRTIEAHYVPDRRDSGRIDGIYVLGSDVTERKHTETALIDETRVLELLNGTGKSIASQLDLQVVVQTVTDSATELCGAKFGAFFYNVINAQGESFMLYSLSGASRDAFASFGLPRNTAVFEPTFRGEAVLRSPDITKDPRYGKTAPHFGMPKGHLPVRSYLAAPVVSRSGAVIGGLFFAHPEPDVFTERAERLVAGVAAQAAIAIDNARLYEAAQRASAERDELLERERTARAEVERASRLKDEFLATLSHELRTPLNAILGWSQVLRYGARSDEDLRTALETIERNARVQTQLIEDLLDMSRITSGKVRLDIQPVDPAAIVDAAVQTVRPATEAKGIRLERIVDPRAGPVQGDPSRLQQVVWNLLSNAIKFTPRDGRVRIVLSRVDSHVEIAVIDTGIGIEPEFLPHVFERFRQGDASSTRVHGGLGLGLSIVKHLVELHGGTVRAESAGKERGSSFYVRLPISVLQRGPYDATPVHPTGVGTAPMPACPADLSGLKVLVVDDERDARELIRRVLTDCRAEVVAAGDADEALLFVERERPHVMVSDIGMPGVDGYELLRRIRARGPSRGGSIPAIALTAFARAEDRIRALRAGFALHVSKPVQPSELVATVASVVGRASGGD